VRVGRFGRDEAGDLAHPGGRGATRAGGARAVSKMSDKAAERLLYLVSPIGLLIVWQILLMLGFGDRRFIPAPSDIAVRFVQLTMSGELITHTLVTLWRGVAGVIPGPLPAHPPGPLVAGFPPVRLRLPP